MGCKKQGHIHTWPTKGTLTIQRCEVRCNFCTGDAAYKDWKFAWFLRRHVRAIHVKKGKYKGLRVDAGWDDENPRDAPGEGRSSIDRLKLEFSSSDGIPQTTGELEQLPLREFVTQSNFGNVDQQTYETLSMDLADRNINKDCGSTGVAYGNSDAQFPTLAGEDAYVMDDNPMMGEFYHFLDSCSGFDGNPEVEEESEDNIVVAGRGESVKRDDDDEWKDLNPIPLSSAGRFFMARATDPEPDLDDMPLAMRMNNYNYGSQVPTDQKHIALVQIVQEVSDSMQQSGLDPCEMLPIMHQVTRSLLQDEDNDFPYQNI